MMNDRDSYVLKFIVKYLSDEMPLRLADVLR